MAKLTAAQVAGIVASGPGPPAGTTIAQWVAKAREESGFDPEVQDYLHSGHWGLWQIGQGHWNEPGMPKASNPQEFASLMRSPILNWEAAKLLYKQHGWVPWKSPPHVLPSDIKAANAPDASRAKSGGLAGDLGGAIPLSVVPEVGATLANALKILGAAAEWLGDPSNWVRIVQVGGGVVLGVAALSIALKPVIESTPITDIRKVSPL